MITYRRYRKEDIQQLLDRLQENLSCSSALRPQGFVRQKVEDLLNGNLNNSMFCCFVAVDNERIVGAVCASVYAYLFSYEACAKDHIFLVIPEYRNINVAMGLATGYVEWAKARKVKSAELSNVTGDNIEAFSRLAERLGFKLIGTNHSMEF